MSVNKPVRNQTEWDVPLNAALDSLDAAITAETAARASADTAALATAAADATAKASAAQSAAIATAATDATTKANAAISTAAADATSKANAAQSAAISAAASDATSKVAAEASTRSSADSALQASIDLKQSKVLGIDGSGNVYYDAAGAAPGEVAYIATDGSGNVVAVGSTTSGFLETQAHAAATYVVKATSATGADQSTYLQGLINAANAAGGGEILLQAGTYLGAVVMKTGVVLRGQGSGATTLKLPNGANTDLLTVPNFATLTGSNGSGGESGWAIRNLTLDGNGSNQTATSWTFRVYGFNYRVDGVEIINGRNGNVYSEWGNSASGNMEAFWSNFKIRTPTGSGAINCDWNGPHDSVFSNGEIVASTSNLNQIGFWNRGNGGAEVFSNVHVWGFHQKGWIQEHSCLAVNCESEGATAVNLLVLSNGVRWGGKIFGSNGSVVATEVGVQIGDATHTGIKGSNIEADFSRFIATGFPVSFFASGSGGRNRIVGQVVLGSSTPATATYTGTPDTTDDVRLVAQDAGTVNANTELAGHPLQVQAQSSSAFVVKGASSLLNVNATSSPTRLEVVNGALMRGYKDLFTTTTFELSGTTGHVQPGTTAGVGARIWSGSGAPTTPGGSITYNLGDAYFRTDTPGTANQRLYLVTTAGTSPVWTGVL